jgi:hypothetical protein
MPTKEASEAAEIMILADEVKRVDDILNNAFAAGDHIVFKDNIPKLEMAKKRLMKIIKELFPGEFKQPGVFIDKILSKHR